MSFPRYPKYKESVTPVFEILPAGWSVTRLKRVVDSARPITYGIVQAGENVVDGVPYVRPADMSDEMGLKSYESLLRTSNEIAYSYRRSAISSGDIVCSIGPSFGKVMITPSELEGGNLTQGTARVSISVENSNRYYFWVLRSLESFQQWESSVGGATFRALNLGPLAETTCPRPPLTEQSQIARFLDHETANIDALIHEQERLIELLKEKRQAVISHAVTKGLDPDVPMKDSGVEWLGEVPVHWDLMPAKFLLEFVTSGSRGWAEYYSDTGYLFFRIANLTRDSIRPKLESIQCVSPPESSEGARAKIKVGDILVSITADLGSVCAADQSVEGGYVSQHVALARPDNNLCHPDWLAYFILGDAAKEQLLGSGYGGTKVQLSLEDIRELVVAVPPLVDQESIAKVLAERLTGMEALISEANQAVNFLAERRSALISAAVTGKIDVRNWRPPADESAYDEEVRQTGMEATV